MVDKTQSRLLRAQIHDVLLDIWDPIGIKDEPNAQNEYDGYVGGLYDLLTSGAPDSALLDYLHHAVYENIGLDATREDMRDTVSALRKIDFPELDS
jgi:hypothetical protein